MGSTLDTKYEPALLDSKVYEELEMDMEIFRIFFNRDAWPLWIGLTALCLLIYVFAKGF